MQFYYGEQMPLRILDEAEFWKQQEAEHTEVIREAVPGLEKKFIDELKKWELALTNTHQTVVSYVETAVRSPNNSTLLQVQVTQLISFCLEQSLQFIELCRQIKTFSAGAKDNPFVQTLLNHIIRESEYFVGIARTILNISVPTDK